MWQSASCYEGSNCKQMIWQSFCAWPDEEYTEVKINCGMTGGARDFTRIVQLKLQFRIRGGVRVGESSSW